MMSKIEAVVACVGYDDFLRLTLGRILTHLPSVTVLTAPWDGPTIEIAKRLGAKLLITDVWRQRGSFNKAAALNEWLASLDESQGDRWLLTVDADILFPDTFQMALDTLDGTSLYGVVRRMCDTASDWNEFVCRQKDFRDFAVGTPEVINGRVWGRSPTSNPAALQGYFQLWRRNALPFGSRFLDLPTAGQYDVEFALRFPEWKRQFLAGAEVLHLGLNRRNWTGRVSERWDHAAELR